MREQSHSDHYRSERIITEIKLQTNVGRIEEVKVWKGRSSYQRKKH